MDSSRRRWVLAAAVWALVSVLVYGRLRSGGTVSATAYLDAVGFALVVPALVLLGAVLLPAFEFVRYRRHRGRVGLAVDLGLVVAAGLAGGFAAAFLSTRVGPNGLATTVPVAVAVYAAAFAAFTARNLAYYDRYSSPLPT